MNIVKKISKLLVIGVSVFVAVIIIALPVISTAGPSAIPTEGNVDARFDTVTSGRFIDEDNSFFYIDPSETSYTNNIQLSGRVTDYPSGSYYIDPASNSYLNNVYGGGNYFFRYYDRTNPAYYLDPSDVNYSLLVAGKVGIGTTTPAKKLHVVDGNGSMTYGDSSGVQVYNAEGSTGEVRLGSAWNRPGVYSTSSLNLLGVNGLALSGRGNKTDLYINNSGELSNPDPDQNFGKVNITDPQGLSVNSSADGFPAIMATATSPSRWGVQGQASDPLGFGVTGVGGNTGVYGWVVGASGIGVRGDGKGSGAGVAGYNNDNSGGPGVFGRNLNPSGYGGKFSGGFYGVYSTAATATGTGGWFRNWDGTADAKLGTPTLAIDAKGDIDLDGKLFTDDIEVTNGLKFSGLANCGSITTDSSGNLLCGAPGGGGDITDVVAGTGLVGGATSGSSTLGISTASWNNITLRAPYVMGSGSGFYQTSTATTAEGWPENATWYHLLNSQHSNTANNYAMQFAGNFYNSNLFYRSTAGSGATAWNEVWHAGSDGAGSGLDADTVDGSQPDMTPDTIADDGVIQEGEIAQNTLDDSEIADNSLSASSLAASSVNTSEIANNAIKEEDLLANTPTNGHILSYNSTSGGFTWVAASSVTDTNAGTICGNGTFLNGDGTCDTGFLDADGVDANTQLTEEQVEDYAGSMLGGTETRIAVTYNDAGNAIDFVVDNMNDDVPESGDFGAATDLNAAGAILANAVTLGTDTVGNYLASIIGGTAITITGAVGEGVSQTIAVTGNSIGDAQITQNSIDASEIQNNTIKEEDLLANTPTNGHILSYNSTSGGFTWIADSTITDTNAGTICAAGEFLNGDGTCDAGYLDADGIDDDVPESGDFGAATDLNVAGAILANAVALGTDTVGNYLASVTGGNAITVTGSAGEGVSQTIAVAAGSIDDNEILANSIDDSEIQNNTIREIDLLETSGTPAAGEILSYNAGGGFTWITNTAGDITDVIAGNGLTGGGAGGAVTLDVNPGNCVTIAGDTVGVGTNCIDGNEIVDNSISNLELQYDTGQHLTTTSSPDFRNLDLAAGNDYGLRFWNGNAAYMISMGNDQANHATVTDYSMHFNMGPTAGRGFTFGSADTVVAASINALTGDIATNGDLSFGGEILPDGGAPCSNGQILKRAGPDSWNCANDDNAGGTMSSFSLAGTGGSNQTITSGDTLRIAQGTGITTTGAATDTVTIAATLGTAIEEGEIAQNTLDDSEIADNSLTASSLAANSVGTSELANDTIREIDLDLTNTGVAGQILSYDGSTGFTWIANAVGDITGVTAGNGLIGGGTSGAPTLNVGAGTGITVAADTVSATLGTAIEEGEIVQNTLDDSEIADNSLSASSLAANSVGTSELSNNSIQEIDLLANAPTNGQILSYNSASGGFTWVANNTAYDTEAEIDAAVSDNGYLTSFTEADPTWSGAANTTSNISRSGYVSINETAQALYASTSSNTSGHYAIKGQVTGTSFETYGVMGQNASMHGTGILGWATSTAAGAYARGVSGESQAPSGKGVQGISWSSSGTNYGVWGRNQSPNGYGGYFYNTSSGPGLYASSTSGPAAIFQNGNVGIGVTAPQSALHIGTPDYYFIRFEGGSNGDSSVQQFYGRAQLNQNTYSRNIGGSGNIYDTSKPASQIELDNGAMEFNTAASGIAGNMITWNNRMQILNNGNVGIGDSTPSYKLDVNGAMYATSGRFGTTGLDWGANVQVNNRINIMGSGSNPNLFIGDSGSEYMQLQFNSAGNYAQLYTPSTFNIALMPGGNVGIGTSSPAAKLHVNSGETRLTSIEGYSTHFDYFDNGYSYIRGRNDRSTVYVQNASHASDERLKKDIEDINYGLDEVLAMRPVSFKWRDTEDDQTSLGFIAQEMEPIINEIITTDAEPEDPSMLGIRYDEITPILASAIQDLKLEKDDEVAELKAEIAELRAVVCELKPEADVCNL